VISDSVISISVRCKSIYIYIYIQVFRGDLEPRNLEPDGTWLGERIDIGLQKPCIRGIWNPGIYTGMWSRAPDCTRAYTLYGLQKVCILSYIYAQTEAPDIYTGIWSRAPDCTRAYTLYIVCDLLRSSCFPRRAVLLPAKVFSQSDLIMRPGR